MCCSGGWCRIALKINEGDVFLSITSEQVDLSPLNTFKVAAKAKYFLIVDSLAAIRSALPVIQQHNHRLVLGGGSNILFISDFDGLVIYPQIKGIDLLHQDDNRVRISVGASENWHQLVLTCLKNGWYGLENLALIPGSVGASPVQNIGAYGVEVKSFIHQVEFIDLDSGEVKLFAKGDCQFGYRDSFFKRATPGRYLITRVEFELQKKPDLCLSYQPLKTFFAGLSDVTPTMVMERVCQIRREKLPDPDDIANAGSFFKNPVVSESQFERLKQEYPQMVGYATASGVKLAAGWLIEHAGFKGMTEGDIGVHKHQALVLVNYGEPKGRKIWHLAKRIQRAIQEKYHVQLEAEVRVIGHDQ